jgi:hypothetical protein
VHIPVFDEQQLTTLLSAWLAKYDGVGSFHAHAWLISALSASFESNIASL